MQKFYTSSNETMFIKSLLYNTYLPVYDTVDVGSFILKGYRYIFETNLIACTKTGYIGGKDIPLESSTKIERIARYEVISSYQFGQRYLRFTDNFRSNTSIYDEATHNRLVKYLRCYRDTVGVNLMPFINLFTDHYLKDSKLMFVEDEDKGTVKLNLKEYYKSEFTQVRIPIKFNTTYTIAMDCNSEVMFAPAFFSHDLRLVLKAAQVENDRDLTNEFNNVTYTVKETIGGKEVETTKTFYKIVTSIDYKNPVTFRLDLDMLDEDKCSEYYKYQNCLYMLIQIPSSLKSSIVVLEGDYKNTDIFYDGLKYYDEDKQQYFWVNDSIVATERVASLEYDEKHGIYGIHNLHDPEMNKLCMSSLSLLQFRTETKFVYSPRLMEYLYENIIDGRDNFDSNISLMQALLPDLKASDYVDGVWGNLFRYKLFKYSQTHKNSKKLDLNGYIDKDTESALLSRILNSQEV